MVAIYKDNSILPYMDTQKKKETPAINCIMPNLLECPRPLIHPYYLNLCLPQKYSPLSLSAKMRTKKAADQFDPLRSTPVAVILLLFLKLF
jgi:hypothetical protein